MPAKPWTDARRRALGSFLANVAFPRLAHRLRWPSRLGRRGLVRYVALTAGMAAAARAFGMFIASAEVVNGEEIREKLRMQLGREPTPEEFLDGLAREGRVRGDSRER